jgi:hypothetical protein
MCFVLRGLAFVFFGGRVDEVARRIEFEALVEIGLDCAEQLAEWIVGVAGGPAAGLVDAGEVAVGVVVAIGAKAL